jgi:hypothetical protein
MPQPINRVTTPESAGPLHRLLDAAVFRHLRKGRQDFACRLYASGDLTVLLTLNAFTLLLFLWALRAFEGQRLVLYFPVLLYVVALPALWLSSDAALRRVRAARVETTHSLEKLFRSYLVGSLVMLAVSAYLAFE